jgi:hypothetical protein
MPNFDYGGGDDDNGDDGDKRQNILSQICVLLGFYAA